MKKPGSETRTGAGEPRNPSPSECLLEVRDLSVQRGEHRALRRVSFDLNAGEFVGIMGRSGAGKTSLMYALSNLVAPAEGSVHWRDQCPGACCAHVGDLVRNQRRAVMFQHYRLVPQLSALTNVLSGRLGAHGWWRTLAGFPSAEKRCAADWLETLGLGGQMHLRAGQLSGGEQQRVALARAMIQEPSLLLADEPIASLDAETANEVMERFRQMNRQHGLTMLCVLHDLEIAERFLDRVLLLDHGELIYDGASTDLQSVVTDRLGWKTLE